MHRIAPIVAVVALSLALAAPAAARTNPSLSASPQSARAGADVTLRGLNWAVQTGCENRVTLYFKQGDRRTRLGSAIFGSKSAFTFSTHYQGWAAGGPAQFVARRACRDGVIKRTADVNVIDLVVHYVGRTENGGRVAFAVVDGLYVTNFRFVNRCAADSRRGTRVPGRMRIGDVSFSRSDSRFAIFGRFYSRGVVKGRAREQGATDARGLDECDSGTLDWRAVRVD